MGTNIFLPPSSSSLITLAQSTLTQEKVCLEPDQALVPLMTYQQEGVNMNTVLSITR